MGVVSNVVRALGMVFFAARRPALMAVMRKVKRRGLSYLESDALVGLARTVLANERNAVQGVIIEAGCALGGSAIVIASAKERVRPFYVYDVFGMIPPPTEQDGADAHERYAMIGSGTAVGIGGGRYYGYEEDLYEQVRRSFRAFGVNLAAYHTYLVKGTYEETLQVDFPVSLAHIDSDWYESVMTCLIRIEPHLVSGGSLIVDDYYCWLGCKRAVDEYFAALSPDAYMFTKGSRLRIVKK